MTTVYASSENYTVLYGEPAPPKLGNLLRSASILVRRETITAIYATDAEGKPVDAQVIAAFQEATCVQAQFWVANSIDPSSGGLPQPAIVQTKKIGTASIVYDTSAQGSANVIAARMAATSGLCLEAFSVLQQAGLVPGSVRHG
jgi:hypothetical protein